jgi:hypothetical protein
LNELDDSADIIEWTAAFVGSDEFHDQLDAFANEHAYLFEILNNSSSKDRNENEMAELHKQWKQLHGSFLQVGFALIENFLTQHGLNMEQYKAKTEEVLQIAEEKKEHTTQSFFAYTLRACVKYEEFVEFMRRAADPEFYLKQELYLEAKNLLATQEKKNNAKDFITFIKTHPDASLESLEKEMEKLRVTLTSSEQ